jgi:Holliday junction resolvase RusA-like endonuclease
MLLFEFFVEGPPVSAQARRRRVRDAWKAKVARAAQALWVPTTPPIASDVSVTITHFYEGAPGDVDNIPKLIIDGMKGVVIADDRQIADLVTQRRPLAGPYVVTSPTPEISRGLGLLREFVHIAIASPPANAELRPYDYP